MVMYIKVLSSFLLLVCITLNMTAQNVAAKNYLDAIYKIQKKALSRRTSTCDYLHLHRKSMLSGKDYWEWESSHEDTIYVCEVVCHYASSYDEYIITSKWIYHMCNVIGRSWNCKTYSIEKPTENIPDKQSIDYVRNWDVNLFKRWNSTTLHDGAFINAIRIVKKSKNKYKYDCYTFYNNSYLEDDPIPEGD